MISSRCWPYFAIRLRAVEARQAERQRLGAALVTFYRGARVEAYGAVLDFSTPDAAVDTINHPEMPHDLAYWLLNAPWELYRGVRDEMGKSLGSSLKPGRA